MVIKQTTGRDQFNEFALKFVQLNYDVLFGEVWNKTEKYKFLLLKTVIQKLNMLQALNR